MRPCFLSRALGLVLCALLLTVPASASPDAPAPKTSAASAILMDAESGRVLYAQNEHDPRPIASITKLMTALVAAESAPDLDALVTVDPQAAGVEGSSIYLTAGEQLTLRDLLYGLLLQSGNDAAVAIAVFCAGDVDTFVSWMNQKAAALELQNTHFMNPNGLDADGHCASAYDMALIAREVLRRPELREIVSAKSATRGKRTLTNHNKLLWRYEGCVGLKTGYTDAAGRTLVSAATRGETTLICVTLKDPNDWADHQALLDYGFANYRSYLLASPGKLLAQLPVWGSLARAVPVTTAWRVSACLTADEQVTARVRLAPRLEAPVTQGDVVGTLTYYQNGVELGGTYLIAAASAPPDRPQQLRSLLGGVFTPLIPLRTEGLPTWRGPLNSTILQGGE